MTTKQLELESNTPAEKVTSNPVSKEKEEQISYFKLYCCATKQDWILIILGSIARIINGTAMPLFSILFGNIADDFGPLNSPDAVVDAAGTLALKITGIGIGVIIASYVGIACWMIAGERQAIRIRRRYFQSLLS